MTMTTISFKVRDEEARAIRAGARRERITVSEFLRRRATGLVAPAPKPGLVRCPTTGAMVFGPAADLPVLTVETTREMLADFP